MSHPKCLLGLLVDMDVTVSVLRITCHAPLSPHAVLRARTNTHRGLYTAGGGGGGSYGFHSSVMHSGTSEQTASRRYALPVQPALSSPLARHA